METEHTVVRSSHQPIPKDIKDAFKEKPINLEALFSSANPFEAGEAKEVVEDEGESLDANEPAL